MATSSRRGHAYVAIMIQWGGIEYGEERRQSFNHELKKHSQFPQTGVCHSLRENEIVEHAKMKHCEVTLDCQA